MKIRISILLVGLMTSACLLADCGGDDTTDSTPGTGGTAGKGGSGGSLGTSGSAGSSAGSAGSAGTMGTAGTAGSSGSGGSAGSAGSGGASTPDAGDAGPGVDGSSDAAKEAATDTGSSSDGATDAGSSSDATTSADVVDAGSTNESSADDASDGAAATSDSAAEANVADATDAGVGVLVINEIFSMGTDYVEFYNKGDGPIDISNWYFTDDANNPDAGTDHKYTFLPGTIVPSHAFLLITQADAGAQTMSIGLGSSDSVILRDSQGNLIEREDWTGHRNPSTSRCPDGTGAFINGTPQTPGAPNTCGDQ